MKGPVRRRVVARALLVRSAAAVRRRRTAADVATVVAACVLALLCAGVIAPVGPLVVHVVLRCVAVVEVCTFRRAVSGPHIMITRSLVVRAVLRLVVHPSLVVLAARVVVVRW